MLRFEIIAALAIYFLSSSSLVFSASARTATVIRVTEDGKFKPDKAQLWLKPKSVVQAVQADQAVQAVQAVKIDKDANSVQKSTPVDAVQPWLKPDAISRAMQSIQNKLSRRDEYLSAHNKVRAMFNEKPLKWDPTLVKHAKELAQSRHQQCTMAHTPNGPYGENLLWTLKGPWTPLAVVGKWVAESKYFDRTNNVCVGGQDCGHYTQIVWATTERVGCGRARCKNGKGFIYVCAYDPPGNYYNEGPFGGSYSNSIVPPT